MFGAQRGLGYLLMQAMNVHNVPIIMAVTLLIVIFAAVVNSGLVWRVFTDRPDETGTFKLVREDRGATPDIVLPPHGVRFSPDV